MEITSSLYSLFFSLRPLRPLRLFFFKKVAKGNGDYLFSVFSLFFSLRPLRPLRLFFLKRLQKAMEITPSLYSLFFSLRPLRPLRLIFLFLFLFFVLCSLRLMVNDFFITGVNLYD